MPAMASDENEKLENPSNDDERLISFLQSLLVWVTELLKYAVKLLNK